MGWLSYKKWVSSSEKYLVSDCFAYEQKLSHRGSCIFSVDQCIVFISSWVDAPHLLSMWVAWLQSIVGIKPTLLPRAKLLGTPLASFIGKHALRNQHISPQWTDIFSWLPRYRVLTMALKYVPPLFFPSRAICCYWVSMRAIHYMCIEFVALVVYMHMYLRKLCSVGPVAVKYLVSAMRYDTWNEWRPWNNDVTFEISTISTPWAECK